MPETKQQVHVRLSEKEKQHLDEYCKITERSQSDILKELVRKLQVEGLLKPLPW